MSRLEPNIGDFLVCCDPINGEDIFRCLVIGENHHSYDTIVFLHNEDNGYNPGERYDMYKHDWKDLYGEACDDTRTYWLIERVKNGT